MRGDALKRTSQGVVLSSAFMRRVAQKARALGTSVLPIALRRLQSYAELSSIFFLRLSGRMSVQISSI